jgi:4a-hydroxytetrahydrobiopterin dehydratase
MPDRLDQALVESSLEALPHWSGDTESISWTVPVTAQQADELLAAVAESAQAMNHDPDIERSAGHVRFVLTTHSAGGVTAMDIAMASRIDDLVAQATGIPAEHAHHSVAAPTEPDGAEPGSKPWQEAQGEDIVNRGLRRMPD